MRYKKQASIEELEDKFYESRKNANNQIEQQNIQENSTEDEIVLKVSQSLRRILLQEFKEKHFSMVFAENDDHNIEKNIKDPIIIYKNWLSKQYQRYIYLLLQHQSNMELSTIINISLIDTLMGFAQESILNGPISSRNNQQWQVCV